MTPRAHTLRTAHVLFTSLVLLAAGAAGCNTRDRVSVEAAPELDTFVELMMPERIEIQRYLTKPVSFAADGNADGLEVLLAPYDSAGDLTKVVGRFQFELTTRKPSETIGTRIGFWQVNVDSEKSIRTYRDSLSRYYQFPLQLEKRPLPPGDYVLSVWLHMPAGKRLFHEYEFVYEGKGAPPASGI